MQWKRICQKKVLLLLAKKINIFFKIEAGKSFQNNVPYRKYSFHLFWSKGIKNAPN
jgi:hypothetical protein